MKFSYNMIPTAVWHFQPPAGQRNTAAFYWMPAARHTDKMPHISNFLSAKDLNLFALILPVQIICTFISWVTGVRADQRLGNPTQRYPGALVVKDKVGRLLGKLVVSKSVECDIFLFSALTLLVGWQEGPVSSWAWFVRGNSLTGALHVLRLQLSPPS